MDRPLPGLALGGGGCSVRPGGRQSVARVISLRVLAAFRLQYPAPYEAERRAAQRVVLQPFDLTGLA